MEIEENRFEFSINLQPRIHMAYQYGHEYVVQVDATRKMTLNILDKDVVLMGFLVGFLH